MLSTGDTSSSITSVANPPGTTGLGFAIFHNYDELNRRTESIWDNVNVQTAPTYATATFDHAYNKVNQRVWQAVDDNSFWHYPPVSASSLSYTANSMNQYTAVGGVSPNYDDNPGPEAGAGSNLTGDGTFTFTYDAENRMVSATDGSTSASYAWDARGHRKSKTVGSTTTIYVTDADNREILEYDGATGQIRSLPRPPSRGWYAYGLGIDDALNQVELSGDRQD